jgi:3-hydroxyacyl-CoA dehydrogenase
MADRSVSVIGAGVMGSGIAQVLAVAGLHTRSYDISKDALAKARESVASGRFGLAGAVERGKLSRADADAALARIEFTDSFERAARADVVIECVPEDLALKLQTFRRLDEVAPPNTILASNTSGFPIAAMAGATKRPERVIGWHWASPPPVMKLAEIVVTKATSEETTRVIRELASACGKNPVLIQDNPMAWGFVANRIYGAMLREAARVVDEGVATHEQVNQLMIDCFRWPVGPFAMVKGATGGWS